MNSPNDNQPPDTRNLGLAMMAIAWIFIFGILIVFFDDTIEEQINPNQSPQSSINANRVEVILEPNRQNHYVVTGTINNKRVDFLLDTGATNVSVPLSMAERLGLQQGAAGIASTANGDVVVYSTVIDSLSIGEIRLNNVRASINPGMEEDIILLGMTALSRIEFAQRGNTLILRQ